MAHAHTDAAERKQPFERNSSISNFNYLRTFSVATLNFRFYSRVHSGMFNLIQHSSVMSSCSPQLSLLTFKTKMNASVVSYTTCGLNQSRGLDRVRSLSICLRGNFNDPISIWNQIVSMHYRTRRSHDKYQRAIWPWKGWILHTPHGAVALSSEPLWTLQKLPRCANCDW